MLKAGGEVEQVTTAGLAERDRWKCGLCGRKVPKTAVFPDPRSASIDHILPVVDGGHHTWANTQLAHLRCNISKGRRGSQQLALVG